MDTDADGKEQKGRERAEVLLRFDAAQGQEERPQMNTDEEKKGKRRREVLITEANEVNEEGGNQQISEESAHDLRHSLVPFVPFCEHSSFLNPFYFLSVLQSCKFTQIRQTFSFSSSF